MFAIITCYAVSLYGSEYVASFFGFSDCEKILIDFLQNIVQSFNIKVEPGMINTWDKQAKDNFHVGDPKFILGIISFFGLLEEFI